MTDEEIKRATKAALAAKPVVTLKKGKRVKEGEEGEEGEEDQKPSRVNKHFLVCMCVFVGIRANKIVNYSKVRIQKTDYPVFNGPK